MADRSTRPLVAHVTRALGTRQAVLQSLGLRPYDAATDRDEPALFVGVYNADDLMAIVQHRGPALVKLCGGDAREARWHAGVLNALPRPRVRVLAGTPLRADCERDGLRVDVWRNVYIGDAAKFQPVERIGPRVYTYCPRARAEEYGIATIRAVAEQLPGVEFYVARWGTEDAEGLVGKGRDAKPFTNAVPLPAWLPQQEMPGILADCFCGIRTVPRDGFSVGATEVALSARPVAHVTDMGVPWIEHAPTAADLVDFVRRHRAARGDLAHSAYRDSLARAARAHVEDDSWLRAG